MNLRGTMVTLDRVPHVQQADQADRLIKAHHKGQTVVCPTDSELAIHRLMRRVRDGVLTSTNIEIRVYWWCDGTMTSMPIRLGVDGELLDAWPGGFFDAILLCSKG